MIRADINAKTPQNIDLETYISQARGLPIEQLLQACIALKQMYADLVKSIAEREEQLKNVDFQDDPAAFDLVQLSFGADDKVKTDMLSLDDLRQDLDSICVRLQILRAEIKSRT